MIPLKYHHINLKRYSQQKGIVLVVSLIMLFVMTLLGVSVMRDAGVNARIVGNNADFIKTSEQAEIATRVAENWVETELLLPPIAQENFIDSGDELSKRKLLKNSVFNVKNPDDWDAHGRTNNELNLVDSNKELPPKFVVAFLSQEDSGSENPDPWDSFQKNSLNVGLGGDVSGRFIFKVYGQSRGSKTKSNSTVETTYAVPFR